MVHKYSEDSLRFLIAFFSHKERCRQNATSHLGLNSQSCQGYFYKVPPLKQGRRWFLESGTAIERRRRSPSAEGTSGGRAREGVCPLSLGGLGGSPP